MVKPNLGKANFKGRAIQRAPLLLTVPASTEQIVMLNRKTPDTLATKITIKAPGDTFTVPIVYHMRSDDERKAKNEELLASELAKTDDDWVNRQIFLYIVKSIDGTEPDDAFVEALEKKYPGIGLGIFLHFMEARRVEVTKN